MTYNVFGGTLSLTQSINLLKSPRSYVSCCLWTAVVCTFCLTMWLHSHYGLYVFVFSLSLSLILPHSFVNIVFRIKSQ